MVRTKPKSLQENNNGREILGYLCRVTGFMILFSTVGIDWIVKSPTGIKGRVNMRWDVLFMFFSGVTRTPAPITSTAGSVGTTGLVGSTFTSSGHISGKSSSGQYIPAWLNNWFQAILLRTIFYKIKVSDLCVISALGVFCM